MCGNEDWKATGRDRERLLGTIGHQPSTLYSAQDVLECVHERVRWATDVMVGEGPLYEHPLPKNGDGPIYDTAVHVHVLLPWWACFGCGLVHWWIQHKLWDLIQDRTPVGLRVFVVVR